MLIAERARSIEDRAVVASIIEEVMNVKIDFQKLYIAPTPSLNSNESRLVWTRATRRLFTLVRAAVQNKEPVLLVGETGSGKTAMCLFPSPLSQA